MLHIVKKIVLREAIDGNGCVNTSILRDRSSDNLMTNKVVVGRIWNQQLLLFLIIKFYTSPSLINVDMHKAIKAVDQLV